LREDALQFGASLATRGNKRWHAKPVSNSGYAKDCKQFPHARGIRDEGFETPLACGIHEFPAPVENSLDIPAKQSQRHPISLSMSRSRLSPNAWILNDFDLTVVQKSAQISIKERFWSDSRWHNDPQSI